MNRVWNVRRLRAFISSYVECKNGQKRESFHLKNHALSQPKFSCKMQVIAKYLTLCCG